MKVIQAVNNICVKKILKDTEKSYIQLSGVLSLWWKLELFL